MRLFKKETYMKKIDSDKPVTKPTTKVGDDGGANEYDVVPNENGELSPMSKVYAVAKSQLGVVEKLIGSNRIIEKYHAYATKDNKVGSDDSVPWCASFVCYCLEMAGYQSTNSRAARSFEKWGTETKTTKIGDIVVFWRKSLNSGLGHVGFFAGYDKIGNVIVLGGNQSDKVCFANYKTDKILSFRTLKAIAK